MSQTHLQADSRGALAVDRQNPSPPRSPGADYRRRSPSPRGASPRRYNSRSPRREGTDDGYRGRATRPPRSPSPVERGAAAIGGSQNGGGGGYGREPYSDRPAGGDSYQRGGGGGYGDRAPRGPSSDICYQWRDQGSCRFGNSCKFLHDAKHAREGGAGGGGGGGSGGGYGRQDRYDRPPADRFGGRDFNRDRPPGPPAGSTDQTCWQWDQQGSCRFGDSCKFAHLVGAGGGGGGGGADRDRDRYGGGADRDRDRPPPRDYDRERRGDSRDRRY